MSPVQNYAEFGSLFGEDQAKKFLLTLHRQSVQMKRLYFWQEQLLSKYCASTGSQIRTLDEALSAFNLCHLHGVVLLRDEVSIQYGTRKAPSKEEVKHSEETFPFANTVAYGPCWVGSKTRQEVMFCPSCRAAFRSLEQKP